MNAKLKELDDRLSEVKAKIAEMEKSKSYKVFGSQSNGEKLSSTLSDEQKLMRRFGCKNIAELVQINTALPRYAHVPLEDKMTVQSLKKHIDINRYCAQIFYGDKLDNHAKFVDEGAKVKSRHFYDTQYSKDYDLKSVFKAFGSTTVGGGDEWVPTLISSNYIEEFELERKVSALFKEIPMQSNPFEIGVQNSVKKARRLAEGADAKTVAANFGTTKITFNADKLVSYADLPEELNEDSAPAILDLARAEVISEQVRAVEDSILNGDTAGTMDSDTGGASDNRRAWDGLRRLALTASSTVTFGGAGVTKANMDAVRKLMGKHGVVPTDLVWIAGSSVHAQLLSVDEVATLEKFGPMATILTGSIGTFRGVPIVISEFVREDLNATGVFDNTTTTRTVVYLVNKNRFFIGRRRPIKVRVQPDPNANLDSWQLSSWQRLAYKGLPQGASERSVVLGINILK